MFWAELVPRWPKLTALTCKRTAFGHPPSCLAAPSAQARSRPARRALNHTTRLLCAVLIRCKTPGAQACPSADPSGLAPCICIGIQTWVPSPRIFRQGSACIMLAFIMPIFWPMGCMFLGSTGAKLELQRSFDRHGNITQEA